MFILYPGRVEHIISIKKNNLRLQMSHMMSFSWGVYLMYMESTIFWKQFYMNLDRRFSYHSLVVLSSSLHHVGMCLQITFFQVSPPYLIFVIICKTYPWLSHIVLITTSITSMKFWFLSENHLLVNIGELIGLLTGKSWAYQLVLTYLPVPCSWLWVRMDVLA